MSIQTSSLENLHNYLCPKNIPNKERITKYVEIALMASNALTPADISQWKYILEWTHTCLTENTKLRIAEKVLERGLMTTSSSEWSDTAKVIMYSTTAPITLLKHIPAAPVNKWLFAKEYLNLNWPTPTLTDYRLFLFLDSDNEICNRMKHYLNQTEKEQLATEAFKYTLVRILNTKPVSSSNTAAIEDKDKHSKMYNLGTDLFKVFDVAMDTSSILNEVNNILETRTPIACTNDLYNRISNLTSITKEIYENINTYTDDELMHALLLVNIIGADTIKYINTGSLKKPTSLDTTLYNLTPWFETLTHLQRELKRLNIDTGQIWTKLTQNLTTGKILELYKGTYALKVLSPNESIAISQLQETTFTTSDLKRRRNVFWETIRELDENSIAEHLFEYLGIERENFTSTTKGYFKKEVAAELKKATAQLKEHPENLWKSSIFKHTENKEVFKTIINSWHDIHSVNIDYLKNMPAAVCLDNETEISNCLKNKLDLLMQNPKTWDLPIWNNKLMQAAMITSYIEEMNINNTFQDISYTPDLNHPVIRFLQHRYPKVEVHDIYIDELFKHNLTGKALSNTVGKLMLNDKSFDISAHLNVDNLCTDLNNTNNSLVKTQRLFKLIFTKLSLDTQDIFAKSDFDFC